MYYATCVLYTVIIIIGYRLQKYNPNVYVRARMCVTVHVVFIVYINTVIDLISEYTLISGHPHIFCLFVILIIISSDFREGNTNLLYMPDGHNGEDYCQST